jgi:hypothetical protein
VDETSFLVLIVADQKALCQKYGEGFFVLQ